MYRHIFPCMPDKSYVKHPEGAYISLSQWVLDQSSTIQYSLYHYENMVAPSQHVYKQTSKATA